MRVADIRGISRRRGFMVTTRRDKRDSPANDLVQRQFKASDPNQLWVADMTYVPTWTGFLYLAVVIDVWSRRVVGWSMGERMTTDLVLSALNMALTQRKPQDASTIVTRAANTPAWPSASTVVSWVFVPRWALWEMPMTMRWLKASSPAWRLNSSSVTALSQRRRLAWLSSRGLKVGTTPGAVTAVWVTSHL